VGHRCRRIRSGRSARPTFGAGAASRLCRFPPGLERMCVQIRGPDVNKGNGRGLQGGMELTKERCGCRQPSAPAAGRDRARRAACRPARACGARDSPGADATVFVPRGATGFVLGAGAARGGAGARGGAHLHGGRADSAHEAEEFGVEYGTCRQREAHAHLASCRARRQDKCVRRPRVAIPPRADPSKSSKGPGAALAVPGAARGEVRGRRAAGARTASP
jgi:hypothetical protein